jgi:hypothetical protein
MEPGERPSSATGVPPQRGLVEPYHRPEAAFPGSASSRPLGGKPRGHVEVHVPGNGLDNMALRAQFQ